MASALEEQLRTRFDHLLRRTDADFVDEFRDVLRFLHSEPALAEFLTGLQRAGEQLVKEYVAHDRDYVERLVALRHRAEFVSAIGNVPQVNPYDHPLAYMGSIQEFDDLASQPQKTHVDRYGPDDDSRTRKMASNLVSRLEELRWYERRADGAKRLEEDRHPELGSIAHEVSELLDEHSAFHTDFVSRKRASAGFALIVGEAYLEEIVKGPSTEKLSSGPTEQLTRRLNAVTLDYLSGTQGVREALYGREPSAEDHRELARAVQRLRDCAEKIYRDMKLKLSRIDVPAPRHPSAAPPGGLGPAASAIMEYLSTEYIKAGFPNCYTWTFSVPGTDAEALVPYNELCARGLIAHVGTGNMECRLTERGRDEVLQGERAAPVDAEPSTGADFIVLTATELERKSVCAAFGFTDSHRAKKGTRVYWRGRVPIRDGGAYDVVVAQPTDQANIDSALLANDAIHQWNPQAALLVGIAGSSGRDAQLGDIVIGKEIRYYERGKEASAGTIPEPYHAIPDATLLNNAQCLPTWSTPILVDRPVGDGRPHVHTGVIASGERVIADEVVRNEIVSGQRKIEAIETEGYGFSRAVWLSCSRVRGLVIRGICDLADNGKNNVWQPYAAAAAAAFALHFLRDRPIESRSYPASNHSGSAGSSPGPSPRDSATQAPPPTEQASGAPPKLLPAPLPDWAALANGLQSRRPKARANAEDEWEQAARNGHAPPDDLLKMAPAILRGAGSDDEAQRLLHLFLFEGDSKVPREPVVLALFEELAKGTFNDWWSSGLQLAYAMVRAANTFEALQVWLEGNVVGPALDYGLSAVDLAIYRKLISSEQQFARIERICLLYPRSPDARHIRREISGTELAPPELGATPGISQQDRSSRRYDYDFAFSFIGEDREYVENVVKAFRGRAEIFYDRDHDVETWGKQLTEVLPEVYRHKARFCVLFISKHYPENRWTRLECRSALARETEQKDEYILVVRFDDTEVPGLLPTTAWVNLQREELPPQGLADKLEEKLQRALALDDPQGHPDVVVRPGVSLGTSRAEHAAPMPGPHADLSTEPAGDLSAEVLDPPAGTVLRRIDVACTWGLSRGGFVGILGGFDDVPVCGRLQKTEGILFHEKGSRQELRFPDRWWFQIPLDPGPVVPAAWPDLRKLIVGIGGKRGAWIDKLGWPANVIPGFVLDRKVAAEDWDAAYVAEFIRGLVTAAPRRPVAIVAHLSAETKAVGESAARRLAKALAALGLPLELAGLRIAPVRREAAGIDVADLMRSLCAGDDEAPPTSPAGGGNVPTIRWWCTCGVWRAGNIYKDARERLKKYPAVRKQPGALTAEEQKRLREHAYDLPRERELARALEQAEPQLVREVLSLVQDVFPAHIVPLLDACVWGERTRRAALRFVVEDVEGDTTRYVRHLVTAMISANSLPALEDLLPGTVPAAGIVVLKEFQRQLAGAPGEFAKKFEDRFCRHLSLVAHAADDPARWNARARAIVDDPAAVAAVLSEPASGDAIDRIFASPKHVRAAFGLLTPAEWAVLGSDEAQRIRVLELRGGRALFMGEDTSP